MEQHGSHGQFGAVFPEGWDELQTEVVLRSARGLESPILPELGNDSLDAVHMTHGGTTQCGECPHRQFKRQEGV
jgi:hypothetical protein